MSTIEPVPNTPQQNRVTKRKYKHLVDTTSALRLHVGFRKYILADYSLATVYIINRLTMEKFGLLAPYELLYEKPSFYDHMIIFCCLCFSINLKSSRNKLDNRGIPSVFL